MPFDWNQKWRIYEKLFVTNSMTEEFSFANYFHYHPANKIWHIAQSLIAPMALSNIIAFTLYNPLGQIFLIIYVLLMSLVDKRVALIYYVLWTTLANLPFFSTLNSNIVIFAIVWPSPFFSHLIFEGGFPAFRMLEAFITTPILLIKWVLQAFNVDVDYWKEIEALTPKWKGNKYEKKVC